MKIVAVEPAGSPVLSDGIPGGHKIQESARDLFRILWIQRFMMRL